MKKRYYVIIIILFLATILIPLLQITNISKFLPVKNQVSTVSNDYLVTSDLLGYSIDTSGTVTSIIIIDGSITMIILGIGLNIFADYVFNKEASVELEQDSRSKIYNLIKGNQGIHLREICRKLDKKMGVIQYHIHVLEKANLIDSVKEGRYRRFFIHNGNGESSKTLLCYLQRDSSRKILEYLAINDDEKVSHGDLAESLGISSQAITWHMKKLESEGIVSYEKIGKQKFYILIDPFKKILLDEFF